jgi:hypothetical protein
MQQIKKSNGKDGKPQSKLAKMDGKQMSSIKQDAHQLDRLGNFPQDLLESLNDSGSSWDG